MVIPPRFDEQYYNRNTELHRNANDLPVKWRGAIWIERATS
jgi:hypothetical protein